MKLHPLSQSILININYAPYRLPSWKSILIFFYWTVDSLIEADPPEMLTSHEGLPADGAAAPGLQGGLEAAPAEDVAAAAGAHKADP